MKKKKTQKKKKIAVDRKGEINIHEINIWKKIFEVSIKILSPSTFHPPRIKKIPGTRVKERSPRGIPLPTMQISTDQKFQSFFSGERIPRRIQFLNCFFESRVAFETAKRNYRPEYSPSRDYDRIELIRVIIIAR